MKFFEIAEQVMSESACVSVFPTTMPGEYDIKPSAYVADKVAGLEMAEKQTTTMPKRRRTSRMFVLDLFSASVFVQVRRALKEENRAKLDALAEQDPVRAVLLTLKMTKGK